MTNDRGEDSVETRVGDLDGRELARIGMGMVGALYANGGVLFGGAGALFSQRLDLDRLVLMGDPVRLAESVTQDWRTGDLGARASETGVLVFRVASRGGDQFRIVDRSGRTVRDVGAPDAYDNFDLSPDKRQIIAARRNAVGSTQYSLWLIDVIRGVTSLVSDPNDPRDSNDPTWAPDSQHIAYMHGNRVVSRLANGGDERTLIDAAGYPDSFTRDGRFLIYGLARGSGYETWAADIVTPGAQPFALVSNVSHADEGRFSVDGRWIAYHSNETGSLEVHVIPFPPTGERWQISQGGGVQPRWSDAGDELFFLNPEGRLMAAKMPDSDPRRAAAPEPLFMTGVVPSDSLDQFAPMGDRFLLRVPVSSVSDAKAVQVVVNWKAGVPR